jgi:hypothetical protein
MVHFKSNLSFKAIIMNKTLLLLLLTLFAAFRVSATDVSGPVSSNTVWTVANSPYVVTGNILVLEGVTLTIEPGVEVRFDASKALQVNWTLVARGNAADSIRFTSNTAQTPGTWGNIYFPTTSIDAVFDDAGNYMSGCILEYCIVEYGGNIEGTDADMLRLDEALPGIRNCTVKNALNAGIGISYLNYDTLNYSLDNNCYRQCKKGIKVTSYFSWLSVTNSSFINNQWGIYGIADLIIDNNLFSQNSQALLLNGKTSFITHNEFSDNKSTYPGSGINSIIALWSKVDFSNNLCQHNGSDLFYLNLFQGTCNIKSNIFTDNVSDLASAGLIRIDKDFTGYDSLYMENNIITNNVQFKPLWVSLINTQAYISSNVITNNYVSEDLLEVHNEVHQSEDTAMVTFADNIITQNFSTSDALTTFSGVIALNANSLYNNTSAYILKNNNTPTFQPYLNVSNNYWGLETLDELSTAIYDFFDDANLGITMFDTILLAPGSSNPVLPPANVLKTDLGNNSVQLSWLPNPEADIQGYNVYWGNYSGYTFEHMADAGLNTSYTIEGASVDDIIAVTAYDNDYVRGKKSTNWLNENMLNGHESAYSFELHFPTGINEINKSTEFSIFPVPTYDKITIKLKNLNDYNALSILDMQGKTLKTILLTEAKTELSIEDFKSGMYFVKLSGAKGMSVKKFIRL